MTSNAIAEPPDSRFRGNEGMPVRSPGFRITGNDGISTTSSRRKPAPSENEKAFLFQLDSGFRRNDGNRIEHRIRTR